LFAHAGSACAGHRGAPAAGLVSGDEVKVYARLLAMADVREIDTAVTEAALRSTVAPLRAAAARAIGQVHATAAAPRLRALLADADTGVAANAAYALGLLRDPRSVASLDSALRLGGVAADAAWALGEIGEPARNTIERALASSPAAPARVDLLLAAAKLRPVPVALVIPYLAEPSPDVAWAAAYAIARPRAASGVRAVLEHRAAPDAETRAQVARALARSAAGDSLESSALSALRELAADAEPHVRINAVRSLATYGESARREVIAAVRDSDANVRIAAAQSVGSVREARRRTWTELWDADTSFMFRRSLLGSAVQAGVILEAIDEDNSERWQLNPDWRYRAAVADAGALGAEIERIVEVSLPLTRDHDGRVRAAAFGALGAKIDSLSPERHPWRREFMATALRDPDFFVRATALTALTGRARATEVPGALESYRLAARDSANDARIAAVQFLAAAWRNDSASFSDSLRATVAALPAPADPLEREPAAGISLLRSWDGTRARPRSLSWYERIVREVILPALVGVAPRAELVTERGTITLELFAIDAPLTVDNFVALARDGYYRDTRFHRVVPNFVAQDGDPRGDGNGGPGYAIRDELNRRRYRRGAVGMALSGPDTGGSQYFITHAPQPHLDGHYTVFGAISDGLAVLDQLVQGDRVLEVRVP
jgi:cyclophilin family peptidyl-prolyl cis-trans isomerase/HEAT repeat protein